MPKPVVNLSNQFVAVFDDQLDNLQVAIGGVFFWYILPIEQRRRGLPLSRSATSQEDKVCSLDRVRMSEGENAVERSYDGGVFVRLALFEDRVKLFQPKRHGESSIDLEPDTFVVVYFAGAVRSGRQSWGRA